MVFTSSVIPLISLLYRHITILLHRINWKFIPFFGGGGLFCVAWEFVCGCNANATAEATKGFTSPCKYWDGVSIAVLTDMECSYMNGLMLPSSAISQFFNTSGFKWCTHVFQSLAQFIKLQKKPLLNERMACFVFLFFFYITSPVKYI